MVIIFTDESEGDEVSAARVLEMLQVPRPRQLGSSRRARSFIRSLNELSSSVYIATDPLLPCDKLNPYVSVTLTVKKRILLFFFSVHRSKIIVVFQKAAKN